MQTKEVIVERKVDTRKVNREKAKYRMKKMGLVQFCKHGRTNNRYRTKKKIKRDKINAPMSQFAREWRQWAEA